MLFHIKTRARIERERYARSGYALLSFCLIAFLSAGNADAQNVVVADTTISGSASFRSIDVLTVGPDVVVETGGDLAVAAITTSIIPRFVVMGGGRFHVLTELTSTAANQEAPSQGSLVLDQNFPNPFRGTTEIGYVLAEADQVEITVYDVFGRAVRTLVSETQASGRHKVVWDATSHAGGLSSGAYYYRITAGDRSLTRMLTLLK